METETLKQRVDDFRHIFGSAEGKRALAHLEHLYWERSSHVPGDPFGTHVREGERNVVREIRWYLWLGANPKELAKRVARNPKEEDDLDG